MSKNYFVNRHGHKADVDNAVQQIAQEELSTHTDNTSVKEESIPPRRAFIKSLISKKVTDGVLLIAAVLAGTALLLGWLTTTEYESRANTIKSAAHSVSTNLVNQEKSIAENIRIQESRLSRINTCNSTVPDLFALIIPGSAKKKSQCQAAVDSNLQLRNDLAALEKLATFLAAQQVVLQPVLKEQTENEFASIPDVTATWQTALNKLASITSDKDTASFKTTLLAKVEAVTRAWEQLKAANDSKNPAAFSAAETALASAYESLRTSANEADGMVNSLQTQINSAYKKLSADA